VQLRSNKHDNNLQVQISGVGYDSYSDYPVIVSIESLIHNLVSASKVHPRIHPSNQLHRELYSPAKTTKRPNHRLKQKPLDCNSTKQATEDI
jgi:hypothetical protein